MMITRLGLDPPDPLVVDPHVNRCMSLSLEGKICSKQIQFGTITQSFLCPVVQVQNEIALATRWFGL